MFLKFQILNNYIIVKLSLDNISILLLDKFNILLLNYFFFGFCVIGGHGITWVINGGNSIGDNKNAINVIL